MARTIMIQMAANTRRGTRRAGLGPRTLLTIVILSTPAVAGDALVQAGLNRIANSIGTVSYTHLTLPTTPYV